MWHTRKHTEAETLRLVNEAVRALDGFQMGVLPPGIPKSPDDCVVARAFAQGIAQPVEVYPGGIIMAEESAAISISAAWGVAYWVNADDTLLSYDEDESCDTYSVAVPHAILRFIKLFDAGKLRHLIDATPAVVAKQPASAVPLFGVKPDSEAIASNS